MARWLVVAILLAGCGSAHTLMRHPVTGDLRECKGPDGSEWVAGGMVAYSVRTNARDECIAKAEIEGYRRAFGAEPHDETKAIPKQR